MPKRSVLIEVVKPLPQAFAAHAAGVASRSEAFRLAEDVAKDLPGTGVEILGDFPPVPLFATDRVKGTPNEPGFSVFAGPQTNEDTVASSVVLAASVDENRLSELKSRSDIRVYPNSQLTLFEAFGWELAGLAAMGGIDCRPFAPAVDAVTIRDVLGVRPFFEAGFSGQGVVVGILDEGIDGTVYPVGGGLARPDAPGPGDAPITSHGSMCAADVLLAAPQTVLYDYPFLGIPDSGGALAMFQAVLDQRRMDGTPHLTNNSYGFVGVPPVEQEPDHEIHNINHPLHRKIREVVASGAPAFFAAGNCGGECPSGKCLASGIGPGRSIHGANSLQEVITVAAVNAARQRVGYSSQGPGMFEPSKPDLCCYTHFFGNFGPGRPGGLSQPFDNGTSAATPVASGVAALLTSTLGLIPPNLLKEAMLESAVSLDGPGWNADTGHGVIDAFLIYEKLVEKLGQMT